MAVMAALSKPFRLAKHGATLWARLRLKQAALEAQIALGERMYATGIDDGSLGEQIRMIEKKLREAEADGARARALLVARQSLLLQLAAAALEEDGPLPGADAEYLKMREAQENSRAAAGSTRLRSQRTNMS